MSQHDHEMSDGFANFILALLALGVIGYLIFLILKFAVTFLLSLIPLVVFYALPFVIFALVFGRLLSFLCIAKGQQLQYRRLIILFPVLGLLTWAVVGFPVSHHRETIETTIQKAATKEVDREEDSDTPKKKKAKDTVQVVRKNERVIEWPKLASSYSSVDTNTNLEPPGFPWQNSPYDRFHLAVVLWLSLILGVPFFFWASCEYDWFEIEEAVRKAASAPLQSRIEGLEANLAGVRSSEYDLRRSLREKDEEIKRLQSRDEFLSKKEKEAAGITTGVLNSDVL
ncbi:MAG: hypothetical protein HYZ71_11940 [Deltaproteobacteria bacterium]|nr:hypothetical protein [Deltaproteobacteria bacterium]